MIDNKHLEKESAKGDLITLVSICPNFSDVDSKSCIVFCFFQIRV